MAQTFDNPQSAPDAMLEQRIRCRAYEIYLARQRDPALFDWMQAESEILCDMPTLEGARRTEQKSGA
jgi:hypothetical protein